MDWDKDALDASFVKDDTAIVEKFLAHYDDHFDPNKEKKTHYYAIVSTFLTFNIEDKVFHHKYKIKSSRELPEDPKTDDE